MGISSETIAVIFDFDDTLVPDSTTMLLESHGIDSRKFWLKDVRSLVNAGYDPALAYLKLLLDNVGAGKPLGKLTNKDLRDFGAKLQPHMYPGVSTLFEDLRRIVSRKTFKNIEIEFYVISGGLQEIVEGNKLLMKNINTVYASQLAADGEAGPLRYIKRCVTFTEKTRYLFEINKGLLQRRTRRNPYLVNEDVPVPTRRVPFSNMIYVGDGLTDIPCFSLVMNGVGGEKGGKAFGVFNPAESRSAKRALMKFLVPKRVISMNAPGYRGKDALGSLLRAAVSTLCTEIKLRRRQAEKKL